MYLSQLILNPRCRAVQRDLADREGLHRTVMALFGQAGGDDARARLAVLFRLELGPRDESPRLLVQSADRPGFSSLPADYLAAPPACKPVDGAYQSLTLGQRLRFRLLANPTRKIDTKSRPDGGRSNGRRVPLRDDEDRLAWLARKGEDAGFRLCAVAAGPPEDRFPVPAVQAAPAGRLGQPQRPDGKRPTITLEAVLFDGLLEVTDPAALRRALAAGIGPGKAYGCGLLSLAPA